MSAVTIQRFANRLREEPLQYTLGITECKGVANIVLGSLQLLAGECMKCSSNSYYNKRLASRHLEIGTKALKRGVFQILPAAIAATGSYIAYRNWGYTETT